jgi:hypothetical protein
MNTTTETDDFSPRGGVKIFESYQDNVIYFVTVNNNPWMLPTREDSLLWTGMARDKEMEVEETPLVEYLARYPEEEHLDRLKNKYVTLLGALYYADINNQRGFTYDSKLNAFRTVVAAANLWFSMQKQWTPPLKWWTPHVKSMGMFDETYKIFCKALDDPKIETLLELFKKLKQELLDLGFEFPNDTMSTFLETIHVKGRPAQIRHTYI